MRLMTKPQSIAGLRKKTRRILEKFRDLSLPRKFEKVISKNIIAKRNSVNADVQICLNCIIETYNCFLAKQIAEKNYPKRKQLILFNNLNSLNKKIDESLKKGTPVPKRYVSNVLKSHTLYFNSLCSKKINPNCSEPYEKLVLSSISVWNNEWN